MISKEFVEKHTLRNASVETLLLKAMYFGVGTDTELTKINNYENDDQHKLRKKLAISNRFITERLLRPVDNIWEARGGNIQLGVEKKDEFREHLKNVQPNVPLRHFMKNVWFQRFVADPNGIILVDISQGKPQLKHVPVEGIRAYETEGTKIKWVLFEPHRKENDRDVSWLIDSEFYYEVKSTDKGYDLLNKVPNIFKEVPAIINSPIYDTETKLFVSPIHKQVELLRSYLVKNSVKEIYQFLHLYPIFWQYEVVCPHCHGTRMINNEVCPVCNGKGFVAHKDVSDVLVLKKPDEETPATIPPAGYVQPDIATMNEQRVELQWTFDQMFESHWGTTIQSGKNETATGRFIDVQPVNKKLDEYAAIAEHIEQRIIDLFAKYYYPLTAKPSSVKYGRRFMIENPDELLKRYQEARQNNAPVKLLDMLLEQFYYAEYMNDKAMEDYYLKMMKVEPYVHRTIEQVMALDISAEEKQKKILFYEWQKTLVVEYVNMLDVKQLNNLLTKYVKENGTKIESSKTA